MEFLLDILQSTSHFAFYYLLVFILVLGVMIFFHELGHFLVAKYFGVKVLKFALGFGPKIVSRDIGETEYSIRYIPLGGFVKMLGEDEETEKTEKLPPEDAEKSFSNKHPFKRMAIAVAGPVFNLFLAILLYWVYFFFSGSIILSPQIGQVSPDSPASRAGILKGDIIRSIDGKTIEDFLTIQEVIFDKADVPVEVTVERAEQLMTLTVTPEETTQEAFGRKVKVAIIGVTSTGESIKREFSPWGAMKESVTRTWSLIGLLCRTIAKLFTGAYSITDLGSPITIAKITGEAAQVSFMALVSFVAFISVNLGILNLLPIPILDGGLIVFLFVELFLGRPLSPRKQEFAQKVGLSMLLVLMAVVIGNEILQYFQ